MQGIYDETYIEQGNSQQYNKLDHTNSKYIQFYNTEPKNIYTFCDSNLNVCSESLIKINLLKEGNMTNSYNFKEINNSSNLDLNFDDNIESINNDSIENEKIDKKSKNQTEKHFQKIPFTLEEDKLLFSIVNSIGEKNWAVVSMFMKQMNFNRNGRQCRDRYFHYLDPKINRKSEWTKEEDELLLKTVDLHGKRWKWMEKIFPGRSEVSLRNRYHLVIRKKIKNERGSAKKQNIMSKSFAFLDNFHKKVKKSNKSTEYDVKKQVKSNEMIFQQKSTSGPLNNPIIKNEKVDLDNRLFNQSYSEPSIFSFGDEDLGEFFNFDEVYFM